MREAVVGLVPAAQEKERLVISSLEGLNRTSERAYCVEVEVLKRRFRSPLECWRGGRGWVG